jgi:prepilin-type N-terminal cleavage/methylation domain-containing protein
MTTRSRGFTLVELIITVAMLSILTTLALPSFLSYLRTAEVQGAAREAQAILAHARQEAIKQNCSVVATRSTGGFTFSRLNCGLPNGVYSLAGMSAGNIFRTSGAVTITGPASVQFNSLGSVLAPATFTLTSTKYSTTMRVFVEASGRTTISQ